MKAAATVRATEQRRPHLREKFETCPGSGPTSLGWATRLGTQNENAASGIPLRRGVWSINSTGSPNGQFLDAVASAMITPGSARSVPVVLLLTMPHLCRWWSLRDSG